MFYFQLVLQFRFTPAYIAYMSVDISVMGKHSQMIKNLAVPANKETK